MVKPTARLAFRALACAWQAQEGSRIDISRFAASPLYSTASNEDGRKSPALKVASPTFGTLEQGTDFKVTARHAIEAEDTLLVTFKGKGRFSGTSVRAYVLRPSALSLKGLSGGRRSLRVKWAAPGKEEATGVQIRYTVTVSKKVAVRRRAASKKKPAVRRVTRTYSKTVTVPSSTRRAKTIGKLAHRGKYQVKVRAYRVVNGKRYAGSWSAPQTARVR